MLFDPENKINRLCAEGMQAEGKGDMEHAARLFQRACDEAESDLEKLTAAHYVARHQPRVTDKLKWDTVALDLALRINSDATNGLLPSLYLNVAKCHEDLNDSKAAHAHYKSALRFSMFLAEDGYGNMIKSGILKGIERTSGG